MSRDGVNWFYGASSPELAVAEKFRPSDRRSLRVGSFATTRAMRLLDLSDESLELPSIFDLDRQQGRLAAIFLHSFAVEIAKPVSDDAREGYRPTQLMTEYMRTDLPKEIGGSLDGIIYPSARGLGHNFVLFHGVSECIAPGDALTNQARLIVDPKSFTVLDHDAAAAVATRQESDRAAAQTSGQRSAWSDWAMTRFLIGLLPR
jgi:hypothetical protein